MATALSPNSSNWVFKPSLPPDVIPQFPTLEALLSCRPLSVWSSPAPTFRVPFCLVAFAGAVASAFCPAHSSLEPSPSANLLLAVPTGVSLSWTVVALQVCMSGKGDLGLIATSFGTSEPGHREELEPGV